MESNDSVLQGMRDAIDRFQELVSRKGLEIPSDRLQLLTSAFQGRELDQFRDALISLLKEEGSNAPFAQVFSDLTTTAQLSRIAFDETLLTRAEIHKFLESLKEFLNSFRHL